MKEVETIPGAVYAVEAEGHIQVINPAGVVVYEGENALSFPAVHSRYEITPDSAAVRQLFKLAPRTKLHLLMGGAGGWLPRGFTELEYLEASGTQWIDTGIHPPCVATISFAWVSGGHSWCWWGVNQSYTNNRGSAWGVDKYNDAYIVNAYAVGRLGAVPLVSGQKNEMIHGIYETSFSFTLNGVKYSYGAYGSLNPTNSYCFFDKASISERLYTATIADAAGNPLGHFVPVLDANGTPCMYDKVSRKCFYNSGTGSFIAGMTMGQLPALLHLPRVTSGELTLSLPWEAQLIASGAPAILEEVKNRGWTLIVQYAEPDTNSAVYNKYAACTNRSDVEAVNPNYRNDLTSDGKWIYPLPNMVSVTQNPDPWFFSGSPVTELDIELPKLTEAYYVFRNASKLKKARVSLPVLTNNQRSFFEDCPLEELYVHAPNLTNLEAFIIGAKFTEITEDMIVHGDITNLAFFGRKMPNLRRVALSLPKVTYMTHSFTNCGLLTSFECDLPSLSNADSSFDRSILNKESTLRILNTIPSYSSGTHNLGLGIHIDHKTDEEVLTAIDNAEVKGWTLTVQWNGTATAAAASTYGLRKPPIYAKGGTIERPDGTTEQTLDWGHYVTNWEENGYTEFASLEEAYAHFNLTMPE